ncbi:MAG: LytTR family DNA-binding domain-containing protein [Chryseolinea sp.]
MNVIIIEDELLAQAKIEHMLSQVSDSIRVVAKISSVKETLQWLSAHKPPDLAFVDIQLSDDHSFEIFKNHDVTFPVVFTTAFDKYLLESFEFNSIDYLLKPITEDKLRRSIDKVKKLQRHFSSGNIASLLDNQSKEKNRLVGKKGTESFALSMDEIAYFYTEYKVVFVRDRTGRQLIVDKNLGELEDILDKKKFFRLNRKFIASIDAIEKFKSDNGKVRVYLKPNFNEEIFVSKESAPEFRSWIQNN